MDQVNKITQLLRSDNLCVINTEKGMALAQIPRDPANCKIGVTAIAQTIDELVIAIKDANNEVAVAQNRADNRDEIIDKKERQIAYMNRQIENMRETMMNVARSDGPTFQITITDTAAAPIAEMRLAAAVKVLQEIADESIQLNGPDFRAGSNHLLTLIAKNQRKAMDVLQKINGSEPAKGANEKPKCSSPSRGKLSICHTCALCGEIGIGDAK